MRARHFYKTQEGRKLLLKWLTPGGIFGGLAMLSRPYKYLLGTEAMKESAALLGIAKPFEASPPVLIDNAMWQAANYMVWYQAAHLALTCHNAEQRLEQVLRGLARAIGQKVPGGITLEVTNEELAKAANISPYMASRHPRYRSLRGGFWQWQLQLFDRSKSGNLCRERERICRNGKRCQNGSMGCDHPN